MPLTHEWTVACRDLAGRRRAVTITASEGKVVIMAPPGEAAVLAPLEVGKLRAALRDAIVSADDPASPDPLPSANG